jgi:branched-chain amino acid aminotransferase
MSTPAQFVWIDHELKPASEAVVPVLNAGLHYGFGVFEGVRCYSTPSGPAVFRLHEHAQRLVNSAHILGIRNMDFTSSGVAHAILKTIAANGFSSCYIRPLIYLDGGMNMCVDSGHARLIVSAWEWPDFVDKEARKRGLRANVSSFTRLHPNIAMTKAKVCGNYVGSMLAKAESQRAGFEEAIMLDSQGFVAECTGENIFVVRDEIVYTVPRATILEGLTREALITLAGDLGHKVVEEPITRDQLYIADEVFVCGTAAEVIGLREIDFRTIGKGTTGPVTEKLQKAFDDLTHGRHRLSKQWLTPVSGTAKGESA